MQYVGADAADQSGGKPVPGNRQPIDRWDLIEWKREDVQEEIAEQIPEGKLLEWIPGLGLN